MTVYSFKSTCCGVLAFLTAGLTAHGQPSGPVNAPVVAGVAQLLAKSRQQSISRLAYALNFDIPAQKSQPIPATETISFFWQAGKVPLQLDFKEEPAHLQDVSVNGNVIPIVFRSEHILIPPTALTPGPNTISLRFTAGNLSLNRNDDYLYTLLVPDRARTVFPCFDQPDLKASFQVSLTIPNTWQALANAPLRDSVVTGTRKTVRFLPSDTISTYLFSFVAGRFTPVSRTMNGRAMQLLHRETDTSKIRLSMAPIFTIHADALTYLAAYTQIPYPFQKFDFAAIPDFQYGGMEHAGAVDYRSAALFLDNGATRDQKLARANVIAHETAHMWFGDLVTMRWFDDVWLKEVFANFMADKVTAAATANHPADTLDGLGGNYDLQFVVDHFPQAYAIDRTEGANPIGQPLANLQEAGTLYGGIIYHKAPIMMRQLERLMGETAFRDGMREYLKKYAFRNATWSDLVTILDSHTPADLQSWNRVWVNETGRPKFTYQLDRQAGKITRFTVSQKGEDGSARLWPQRFEVTLVYADGQSKTVTADMTRPDVTLTELAGTPSPSFVVFNSSGQGYGLFPVDTAMLPHLATLKDPVTRAATYINLYENMLTGTISPAQLATLYRPLLATEPEELNLRLITSQLGSIVWDFTRPENRPALAAAVEKDTWQAMEAKTSTKPSSGGPSSRGKSKLLFRLYQTIADSPEARQRLYGIWDSQRAPDGVTLTEDDYTSLALALAVRDYPADSILARQLTRIKNPDRQKRLVFMMPALAASEATRDAFFAGLASPANREHEAWVTAALGYLHHPLRAETSVRYLPKSLALLEEIQRTGDIFFPESWLRATLGSYQTPATTQLVRQFLADRPAYNARLRAKLLQAADGTFRASKLLYAQRPMQTDK